MGMKSKSLDQARKEKEARDIQRDVLLALVKRAGHIAIPLEALEDLKEGDGISITVMPDGVMLEFHHDATGAVKEGKPMPKSAEVIPLPQEETHDLRDRGCAERHAQPCRFCSPAALATCLKCGEISRAGTRCAGKPPVTMPGDIPQDGWTEWECINEDCRRRQKTDGDPLAQSFTCDGCGQPMVTIVTGGPTGHHMLQSAPSYHRPIKDE